MKFARESAWVVVPLVVLALLSLILSIVTDSYGLLQAAVSIAVIAFVVLLFFRDPARIIPEGSNLVLAPADGRVLLSDTMEDGRKRVAIFMSVLNVHVNRCPVSGKVVQVDNIPGTYFNAATDDAAKRNARVFVKADAAQGKVEWLQISGLIARKISCRLKAGDSFRIGDRFGLIYFGSRMEVYLPESACLIVKPGEKVRAGESIIAKFA
jgi:phosphatidylserine decarboxylase